MQTEFTVTVTNVGTNKMHVAKAVQEITGLSFFEAGKLLDAVPAQIVIDVPIEYAESSKQTLERAGAQVEIT